MKRKTLKFVSAALALVMTAGCLVGCGGNDNGGGAASNGRTLTISAQMNGLGEDWLKNAAAAYEKKTGTKVNYQFDAYLSTNMTTTLDTTSLEVSDVYFVQSFEWGQWSYNGHLEDLTDFLNEKDENGKSLNDRMTATKRYILDEEGNEKQTIIPFTQAPTGIVYNKKMMKYLCQDVLGWEADHEYPVNTKEMYEVMDALYATTKKGDQKELFTYKSNGETLDVKPFVWSGSTGMLEFFTKAWFYQYAGIEGMSKFFNSKEDFEMINDPTFYQAYQSAVDLLQLETNSNGKVESKSSIPNCVSYNHTASQQYLIQGQALMCPTGSWFYAEMKEMIQDEENLGFMPVPYMSDDKGEPITAKGVEMPKNEDGSYANYTYINTEDFFIVPSRAKNKDDAKDFLKFLFSEEYMPQLQTDLQSPLCFTFDDSTVKKGSWFNEVAKMSAKTTFADVFTGNKMQIYGMISYYHNPDTPPFARLSLGDFGDIDTWMDSATGEVITSKDQADGIAVTENVYNYVYGNYERAIDNWEERVRVVEGK